MVEEKYTNLIKCLRQNSRDSLTNISKRIKVPISTVHDRIKTSERKFIKKYTSIVDFEKLGFLLRTKILINSKNEKINEFIAKNKNINSVFELQGNYNLLLDCVFKDNKDFNSFINKLSLLPIHSKEIYFIVNEIKREEFLGGT